MTRASLWHYRGISLMVTLAVAVAVALLAGGLLVERSVSAGLREIALQRLGSTDVVVSTSSSFDQRLGAAMRSASPDAIANTSAFLISSGTATDPQSGRMAAGVAVYGVDESFWSFHGVAPVLLEGQGAAISPGLAGKLSTTDGGRLILRVSGPVEIPRGTLLGRRNESGTEIGLTVARTIDADRMGEFSLARAHGPPLAVFVPLRLLQRELGLAGRVNAILVQQALRADASVGLPTAAVERAWIAAATLSDHGVALRRVPGDRVVSLEGRGGLVPQDIAARVQATLARLGRPGVPALTYVATSIRAGDRVVPWSIVTAIDMDAYNRLSIPSGPPVPGTGPPGAGGPVVRGNLDVRVGTRGSRVTRFSVQAPEPRGPVAGSGESEGPPGPVEPSTHGLMWLNEWAASDLGVRIGDTVSLDYLVWTDAGGLEDRTASFALQGIVPMMRIGGDRTLTPDYPGITNAASLSAWDPPFPVDLSRVGPRDEAYWNQWRTAPKVILPLEIGQALWGTRFGNVSSIRFALQDSDAVSAAVRSEMSGQAIVRPVRLEALAASAGTTGFGFTFLACSAFVALSALMMAYLFLALGVEQRAREVGILATIGFTPADIRRGFMREALALAAIGALVGAAAAPGYAALVMRGLQTWWAGAVGTTPLRFEPEPYVLAIGVIGSAAAAFVALWPGTRSFHYGLRNAGTAPSRPAGTVLCILMIALATFLIVSVVTAGRGVAPVSLERSGSVGGYLLMAETVAPLMADPNGAAGRAQLGLNDEAALDDIRVTRARLHTGDEASRLSLYRPLNPRILGVDPATLAGRFSFTGDDEDSAWRRLDTTFDDDAIPAIAEEATLTRVFGLKVGDTLELAPDGRSPVRFRFVAALSGSVLQSGIIIGEDSFVRIFPRDEGYRVWLVEAPESRAAEVTSALGGRLASYGVEVVDTRARLAAYHQVGHTYLPTFLALGSLGLLLGVLGVGAAMARNVVARRRESGAIRAAGDRPADRAAPVLAQSALVVAGGVALGVGAALLVDAPWLVEQGPSVAPGVVFAVLAVAVACGLAASLLTVRMVTRVPTEG